MTDNYAYSLFYIRDREIDFVTCGVREHGVVFYDEKFPTQLETIYAGLSGWVYEVEAGAEPTKINGIYVLEGNAEVTDRIFVPNVLAAIKGEIEKGRVDFLAYDQTTQAQRLCNQEGMLRLFLSERNMHPKKEQFLRSHFPEAWEKAKNVLA